MMFESTVLNEVEKLLGDVKASFTCGCLFVECSVEQGVKLETVLLKKMKCAIILSRIGNETAYDFV